MSPKRRMPALLASTSTGPKRVVVSSTRAVHDAASLTSWCTKCAEAPSSSARAWPSSLATSAITVRAPSATKARAIAAPWPCAAPVTMAILWSSRPMVVPFGRGVGGQTVSCMIESAAKPTEGSRSAKKPPTCASRSASDQVEAVASKRRSTTGAATRATIPP